MAVAFFSNTGMYNRRCEPDIDSPFLNSFFADVEILSCVSLLSLLGLRFTEIMFMD